MKKLFLKVCTLVIAAIFLHTFFAFAYKDENTNPSMPNTNITVNNVLVNQFSEDLAMTQYLQNLMQQIGRSSKMETVLTQRLISFQQKILLMQNNANMAAEGSIESLMIQEHNKLNYLKQILEKSSPEMNLAITGRESIAATTQPAISIQADTIQQTQTPTTSSAISISQSTTSSGIQVNTIPDPPANTNDNMQLPPTNITTSPAIQINSTTEAGIQAK